LFETVEELRVRIVLFNEIADQLGGILGEVEGAQMAAQLEMAFDERPLAEGVELFGGVEAEDGLTDVEEVDAA